MAWNEYTVDKFSYLKWPKIFINVELKDEVIDTNPLFPKLWTVLNFKVLTSTSSVQRSESNVQSAGSRVQCRESSVQSPASRVQVPVSRMQRPESSVQLLRPESRNSGIPFRWNKYYCFVLTIYKKTCFKNICHILWSLRNSLSNSYAKTTVV